MCYHCTKPATKRKWHVGYRLVSILMILNDCNAPTYQILLPSRVCGVKSKSWVGVWCRCRHSNSNSNGGDPRNEVLHPCVCRTSLAVVQHVRPAVRQILHHRCHRPCRRRAGRTASRCNAGAGLLRQGQWNDYRSVWLFSRNGPQQITADRNRLQWVSVRLRVTVRVRVLSVLVLGVKG